MQEKIEELLEWVERLRTTEKIIVVEGKEDIRALRNLGITNTLQLNRQPLYKIVERLVSLETEVIILTDLDKAGKKLYAKLNHELNQFGVKIDNKFRHFLFKHTTLRQIEGIDSYVEKRTNPQLTI